MDVIKHFRIQNIKNKIHLICDTMTIFIVFHLLGRGISIVTARHRLLFLWIRNSASSTLESLNS